MILTDLKSPPRSKGEAPHIRLRLLETTDVHANLMPFDYYSDRAVSNYGLTRTATLIHEARHEATNCLLMDNGDFLQGTPISDMTAQPGSGWMGPHPAITAMNFLKYDAAGLGNHEFNFGLEWLHTTLADASFPVTCANALTEKAARAEDDKALFPPFLMLERRLRDNHGNFHDLRIGVLGLVPPQITTWDHFHLKDRLFARDMLECARVWLPRIKAAGADIIVGLVHSGIDSDDYYPCKENVALALAELPEMDAVLAGHTHEVFPLPGQSDIVGSSNSNGTLNGTPAVMAGFRGDHLGVLDLYLRKTGAVWCVTSHQSQVRAVKTRTASRPAPADAELEKLLLPAHKHTLDLIRAPLGQTVAPLHSYLALVRNDPATQVITRAQRAALARLVQGTPDAALPILSATAPFKTGGRGGPKYFSDVPAGDFCLRHAADLYAFPNSLCGLRLNGAQLRDWLERATGCFQQVVPGQPDQGLANPKVPGHNFDVIHGLTYQIDLTEPAQYDHLGRMINPQARRIVNLCFEGQPIDEEKVFLMAVNSFRAHGGGLYPRLMHGSFAAVTKEPIRDVVAQYVREAGVLAPVVDEVWSFLPHANTSVLFDTGPGVRGYPDHLAALGATDIGTSDEGFARVRLPLDPARADSLANPSHPAYVSHREVGAGERLANPVRSGRKQP